MQPRFAHIRDWIFDLDNCLYPASAGIFTLVDQRMTAYVQRLLNLDHDAARVVQKAHFRDHGTTLAGLMREHQVDPHHFLGDVHDIPLDAIAADARLSEGLGRLPGRKFVFTNGDAPYARRVLGRLGIDHHFDHVHDLIANDFRPKPDVHGYELLIGQFGIDPAAACMVEDMARNLKPAKALGMTTVWVDNGSDLGNHGHHPDFIDETIADVGQWLETLMETPA